MAEYVGHFKDVNANALGAHAIKAALERSGVPAASITTYASVTPTLLPHPSFNCPMRSSPYSVRLGSQAYGSRVPRSTRPA